ncbi:DUF1127 domain-containing protein [Bradyrhizobium cenepequi]
MLLTEQLFHTRPQSQNRMPYRTDGCAAPERPPKYHKAQPSPPRQEVAQPDRTSSQGTPVRAQYPRQAPSAPRWYVSISAMVMFLLSKMIEELAIRQAMAELRDLDDRMLRDIGLSRYDIASIRRRDT